ncbi:class I SAM-dependent methyltransferase [bacterium]
MVEKNGGIAEEGMTVEEFYEYSAGKGPSRHLGAIAAAFRNTSARTVLDVGCGPGFTVERLSENGGSALFCGCDTEPEVLRLAAGRESGVRWVCNGPDTLPFADGAFDLVFSEGSLHHFENPMAMFAEMWRVLRPGGRLLLIDLNPKSRAARMYLTFISTKKLFGIATKSETALMMSIKNSLPMDMWMSMMEGAGIPAMVSRTLASVYYEARKPEEGRIKD